MKRLIYLLGFIFLVSCSKYVDEPKNLVDKKTMSEIIADLAINDQISYLYEGKNLESGTRYILNSHKVKPNDFIESYKYYVAIKKMKGIVDNAQDIILEKDPKAEQYIKEKADKEVILPNIGK